MIRKVTTRDEARNSVEGSCDEVPGRLYRQTKVAQAVQKAAEVFARRPLPVDCEAEETDFLDLPRRCQCDQFASWLAVYRNSAKEPWRTSFLCARCKREVQQTLSGNLKEGQSLVLVKDWRV